MIAATLLQPNGQKTRIIARLRINIYINIVTVLRKKSKRFKTTETAMHNKKSDTVKYRLQTPSVALLYFATSTNLRENTFSPFSNTRISCNSSVKSISVASLSPSRTG